MSIAIILRAAFLGVGCYLALAEWVDLPAEVDVLLSWLIVSARLSFLGQRGLNEAPTDADAQTLFLPAVLSCFSFSSLLSQAPVLVALALGVMALTSAFHPGGAGSWVGVAAALLANLVINILSGIRWAHELCVWRKDKDESQRASRQQRGDSVESDVELERQRANMSSSGWAPSIGAAGLAAAGFAAAKIHADRVESNEVDAAPSASLAFGSSSRAINPASGFSMMGGVGGLDMGEDLLDEFDGEFFSPSSLFDPHNGCRTTDADAFNSCSSDFDPSSDFDSLPNFMSDAINPASGLPMLDGFGGVDSAGNAFGFSSDEVLSPTDFSDPFPDSSSAFTDTFSSSSLDSDIFS